MIEYPRWKYILLAVLFSLGVFFTIPNFLPKHKQLGLPSWWQPVNLGLDLQGGSQLLLQVRIDAVIKEQMSSLSQSIRSVLREKKIRYTDLKAFDDKVTVNIISADKLSVAVAEIKKLDRESLDVSYSGNIITVNFNEVALTKLRIRAVEQSIEIVRKRVDELGTREPSIQAQGKDRIVLQLPGVDDPDAVKRLLGKTAKMTFHLVNEQVSPAEAKRGKLPPSSFILSDDEGGQYVLHREVVVGGDRLVDASPSFQDGGAAVVSFRFDTLGAKKFGAVTRENIGNRLAIVLDGKVISAPNIQTAILGGSGVITGSFTIESATELAMLLRAGALPAPLEVIEERTVGPGLGTDSIEAGTTACVISFIIIIVAMIAFYGLLGVFASGALIINMFLLLGTLSFLQATLTLPGIAGIALTLAMAVDANILFYERMREEKRLGRSPANIIEAGFQNAMAAILDSNITTFAAGFALFYLGSGPVKGFGVTLVIGIITTLISSILGTRSLMNLWYNRTRPETINI